MIGRWIFDAGARQWRMYVAGDVYITEISLPCLLFYSPFLHPRFRYFLIRILRYFQSLVQSFIIYLHNEALASF